MSAKGERIPVLDRGYVRLVDVLGDDLSVVNAARVSFDKEATALGERDARLVRYLVEHGHTSPFRHAAMTFEVYAPLMIARQWQKYVVGSTHSDAEAAEGFDWAWNESSRRYVTEEPVCYVPDAWRKAPPSKKQGRGAPFFPPEGAIWSRALARHVEHCIFMYEQAIEAGICAEQARLFLPAYALYVRWRWTASLQAVALFLRERLADDAQAELGAYAHAIRTLALPLFPVCLPALVGDVLGDAA